MKRAERLALAAPLLLFALPLALALPVALWQAADAAAWRALLADPQLPRARQGRAPARLAQAQVR